MLAPSGENSVQKDSNRRRQEDETQCTGLKQGKNPNLCNSFSVQEKKYHHRERASGYFPNGEEEVLGSSELGDLGVISF